MIWPEVTWKVQGGAGLMGATVYAVTQSWPRIVAASL